MGFNNVICMEFSVDSKEMSDGTVYDLKNKFDQLPAHTKDLIVVTLARELQQLLCSFQPFSNFSTFAVKLFRLLVVLHS